MAKWRVLILLLFSISFNLWAQIPDRLNPPFPRTAVYSTYQGYDANNTYSMGSRLHRLAQYDMVCIYGSEDDGGPVLAQRLRELNPDQILIAMGLNGFWFSDPYPYYLYRSYRGVLTEPLEANQRLVKVDSTQRMDSGLYGPNLLYAVINDDIIKVEYIASDTTWVARTGTDDFYAISRSHAVGDTVYSPMRLSGPGIFPNFSQWSPQVDGQYAWEYLAEKNITRKVDWSLGLFDGFFHDAFYHTLYLDKHTMDLNMNGVDDYTEFGSTRHNAGVWINNHYREYLGQFVQTEQNLMQQAQPGLPNLFSVNAGGTLNYFRDMMNGHCYEGFLRWADYDYLKDDCMDWMKILEQNGKPNIMFIEDYIPEKWTHNGKDRFSKMRFGLTTALMYSCYYGMVFGDWYYIMFWYDEFETDLGYPTGDPQTLPNGLMVRYFDKGVAVCNGTGTSQTLNASDLNGTFYRLKGGQDPVMNNGELFTGSLVLEGNVFTNNDLRGDGVLMFYEPTTVVSDVIVDNFYNNDTSPGNKPVELVGGWSRQVSRGDPILANQNPYWSQRGDKLQAGDFDEAWGYHAKAPGDGSSTATYRPAIGVAGWYEISEWHGWHGDYPTTSNEGTNVPFKIVTNDTVKIRGTINQSINYGQWNRLGYAYLPAGEVSYVQLSDNANGLIIADAIRFRYLGEDFEPDTIPPKPPENVQVIEN